MNSLTGLGNNPFSNRVYEDKEFQTLIDSYVMKEDKVTHEYLAKLRIASKQQATLPTEGHTQFQTARRFLNHFGYLNFDKFSKGDLKMLAKTGPLIRDIKGLDRKYSFSKPNLVAKLPSLL